VTPLRDVWDRLTPHPGDNDGYLRLRLASVTACATYAARSATDGAEALLLELGTESLAGIGAYPHSAGFDVRSEVIALGRAGRTRLLLRLANPRFRDVFHALCDDVVQSLAASSEETEAVRSFVARLTRWQAFLRRHSPEGLSLEERRGLFGELLFLRDVLLPHMDGLAAVRSWKGWQSANHDFQLPAGSVEVKTTSANLPHAFHVSNVGQLDDGATAALFVHLVQVSEEESGASSLPELVASVRERLPDDGIASFDDALVEFGYLDAHAESHSLPRYTIRSRRYFVVEDGFPRLLGNMVPPGVEEVSYAVAIAACAPFEREIATVIASILPESVSNHE
jgi:hypothetical protein